MGYPLGEGCIRGPPSVLVVSQLGGSSIPGGARFAVLLNLAVPPFVLERLGHKRGVTSAGINRCRAACRPWLQPWLKMLRRNPVLQQGLQWWHQRWFLCPTCAVVVLARQLAPWVTIRVLIGDGSATTLCWSCKPAPSICLCWQPPGCPHK